MYGSETVEAFALWHARSLLSLDGGLGRPGLATRQTEVAATARRLMLTSRWMTLVPSFVTPKNVLDGDDIARRHGRRGCEGPCTRCGPPGSSRCTSCCTSWR